MSERIALIAVDVQADYLTGGSFGLTEDDRIIKALLEDADRADVVIASRDLHPSGHFSFATYGVHCVKGTKGAKLAPEIQEVADYIVTKGEDKNKGGYSAFEGGTLRPLKSLEEILKDEKIDAVIIGGYLLGWCVSNTAYDANALGYPTTVDLSATFIIGPYTESDETSKLQKSGVKIVRTI